MAKIEIQDLYFSYPGSAEPVFNHLSLTIDTDWKLGLIGRNGKGKTTLLRLLLGKLPFDGKIFSPIDFDYYPFPIKNKEKDTGKVMEQVAPRTAQWEWERELSLLGVGEEVLERPFSTLSPGEQTKVEMAALFLKENRFLLIDEPTNHLDQLARKKLGTYLSQKKGFILVSHDRTLLDACVDHILAINRANVELQQGNFSAWQQNRAYQDQFELAENRKLQGQIRQMEGSIERSTRWSGKGHRESTTVDKSGLHGTKEKHRARAKKLDKQAKATENRRQKALAEKKGLLKNTEKAETLTLHPLFYRSNVLFSLEKVQVVYEGRAAGTPVTLTLHRGERIALLGNNGSGKSGILKLLAGIPLTHTGQITVPSDLVVSYVPQETASLCGSLFDFARQAQVDETLFLTILRKLDFPRAQLDKPLETFSEGQKKKACLAASLAKPAHLYLWDEPLNYLDVIARQQVEDLVLRSKPSLLFVEHDAAFSQAVGTDFLIFSKEGNLPFG